MRKYLLIVAAVASATITSATSAAFAQDSSKTASPQNAQVPKKPKVWTNDDVGSLRSPADVYAQDEQKDAQQATPKQTAPSQGDAVQPAVPKPTTVHEADDLIARQKSDLVAAKGYVEDLKNQINDPTLSDKAKERLEWRLKSRSLTVDQIQTNLTELQKDRDALAKKSTENGSAGSAQP